MFTYRITFGCGAVVFAYDAGIAARLALRVDGAVHQLLFGEWVWACNALPVQTISSRFLPK